jgi:hypothetical protein
MVQGFCAGLLRNPHRIETADAAQDGNSSAFGFTVLKNA